MKLSDVLVSERIEMNLTSTAKVPLFEEMIGLVGRSVDIADPQQVLRLVQEREALGSTGMNHGVGIPHARLDNFGGLVAALGISRGGIEYQSPDGLPVHLVLLILGSVKGIAPYMSVLSRAARILRQASVREQILAATDTAQIIALIRQQEPI